jgi:hypothetical protein
MESATQIQARSKAGGFAGLYRNTIPELQYQVLDKVTPPQRTKSSAHHVTVLVGCACGEAVLPDSEIGCCELLVLASEPGCVAVLSGCAAAVLSAEAPSAAEAPPASRLFGTVSKSSIIWE